MAYFSSNDIRIITSYLLMGISFLCKLTSFLIDVKQIVSKYFLTFLYLM